MTDDAIPKEVPEVFSLSRKKQPVHIEKEDGATVIYNVREMTGKERDAYVGTMTKRMNKDSDGNPTTLKSFEDLQSYLLSITMEDEEGERIPIEVIRGWPVTLQEYLFDIAQDLSDLVEEEEEEEEEDESGED